MNTGDFLVERLKAWGITRIFGQRVVWDMSPQLPDDAIVTSDSGSCANWYARDYRVKRGQMCSLSGGQVYNKIVQKAE